MKIYSVYVDSQRRRCISGRQTSERRRFGAQQPLALQVHLAPDGHLHDADAEACRGDGVPGLVKRAALLQQGCGRAPTKLCRERHNELQGVVAKTAGAIEGAGVFVAHQHTDLELLSAEFARMIPRASRDRGRCRVGDELLARLKSDIYA